MKENKQAGTWEQFEKEVFEWCELYYRDGRVQKNVRREGIYSKRSRQIDVLIEQNVGGNTITILVECKFYNKKIDVKSVESFISMIEDVGADSGILITEKGFTKSALNRAYYNPKHIELDILSFAELKSHLHGEFAIPYSGNNGVLLLAPFGWIIDASKRYGATCMLYQRGLNLEEAATKKELAYINFWDRNTDGFDLEKLIDHQQDYMQNELKVISLNYLDSVQRNDARTRIRIANVAGYPSIEVTAFIEFDDFIMFCVWFSLETSLKRTITKLNTMLKLAIPVQIKFVN